MTDIPRRSLAAGAGLLVGAMTFGARAQQMAQLAAPQLSGVVTVPKFITKPLVFNPEKVKGLSAGLLRSHHDNEYAGVVKRLNTVSEELAKLDFADTPVPRIGELKREEQIAHNSTILHEIYFDGIAEAPTQPSGLLAQAMSRDFGSLERWQPEPESSDLPVIMAYSARDKRLFNQWAADDSMAPAGGVPLLAMDMYEHAYAADYGSDAPKYIEAFVRAIKWTNAERLYREAMRV